MAAFATKRSEAENKQEQLGRPFIGSLALHGGLVASLFLFGLVHHNMGESWGTENPGGAIQANLVSNAPSIPLPQDQKAVDKDNVLATETPSQAPAPPAPKAAPQAQDDKAVPIPIKNTPPKKDQKNAQPSKTPAPPTPAKTQPSQANSTGRSNSVTPTKTQGIYGSSAPNMARSTPGSTGSGNPVSVNGGDFGTRFGYYVSIIQRKVRENWYTSGIDPRTPQGTQAIVSFSIRKDGTVSSIQFMTKSNSPTLNDSAVRAVQRVDSFGPLPAGYNQSSVSVAYTFTFEKNN